MILGFDDPGRIDYRWMIDDLMMLGGSIIAG